MSHEDAVRDAYVRGVLEAAEFVYYPFGHDSIAAEIVTHLLPGESIASLSRYAAKNGGLCLPWDEIAHYAGKRHQMGIEARRRFHNQLRRWRAEKTLADARVVLGASE